VQLFGEDQAFEYLKKLHANINQYTKSGTAPIRAAARGETGVGIVFLHDAVTQKQAGFPIVEVTPSEGTGYEIGGLSIIHGARHLENAQRFADFALSPEAQDLGEQAHAFQIPSNENARIPPSAPAVDPAKIIDFDFRRFGSQAERDRLLRRWETEVNAAAR
jgi:iron(III) transport system substrate-binding protein